MTYQTTIQPSKLHTLCPQLLNIRRYLESYSTMAWLQTREHNMIVLKGCIAAEHLAHVEDIDIGVGDEMLLGDLVMRVSSERWSSKAETSDTDCTIRRMRGLMASLPQFGIHMDRLCPMLDELFCVCLHAMVYATVDITDKSPSLPSVEQMEIIMKQRPVLQGAEVTKKELVVRVLTAAYRHAMDQVLLRVLPIANRRKVLASL